MEHEPTPFLMQAALAAPLAPAPGGDEGPAGEIQLFPAGRFAALDGRPATLEGLSLSHWRLDAGDAAALVAEWRSRATPLVVDYEHQTQLAAHNGQPAPAAGWLTSLRWEDGRGLFASVDWTDRARAHIRAGEYRYISPVFCFDPQSGAVLRLVCAALTNHPALDGMAAARATLSPREESPMKQMLAALGLPETADEAAALAALNGLQRERDDAVAVRDELSAANFEKALGLMQSFQADGGRPLGLGMGGKAGTLLVVPPSLFAAARRLIAVELVNNGESNPWYDAATIISVPWLLPPVVGG